MSPGPDPHRPHPHDPDPHLPDPALAELLSSRIRDVPDFPEPGIVFKDIGPLLADPVAFAAVVEASAAAGRAEDGSPLVDRVLGTEARGFILAAPVALALGVGFVAVRKAGKLPGATVRAGYTLEYGEAVLELQRDALAEGDRVLLVDDVLATGGTLAAAASLVTSCGAEVVSAVVLLELGFLDGRRALPGVPLQALHTVR